jgi:hypothetical protein
MAIKNKRNQWICSICRDVKKNPAEADACRDAHDIIYVPFQREDLNRLIHILYETDSPLTTESMMKAIRNSLKLGLDK